jgi:LemA protein
VPSLVKTTQGYARHERETLEQALAARGQALRAESEPATGRGLAESNLTAAVGRLFALAEAYPDLKADRNFLSLQRELVVVEDHLQSARRYYNAVVRDLNTAVETFPTVLLAGPLGFQPRAFFQLDDPGERQNPGVALQDS